MSSCPYIIEMKDKYCEHDTFDLCVSENEIHTIRLIQSENAQLASDSFDLIDDNTSETIFTISKWPNENFVVFDNNAIILIDAFYKGGKEKIQEVSKEFSNDNVNAVQPKIEKSIKMHVSKNDENVEVVDDLHPDMKKLDE